MSPPHGFFLNEAAMHSAKPRFLWIYFEKPLPAATAPFGP